MVLKEDAEEKRGDRYELVGNVEEIRGRSVAIFDLDGVLIDSSARFKSTLAELGVSEEEFTSPFSDKSVRRMFWKIFLSEKYMNLDKPVKEAIELAWEKKREGNKIVIISGRPAKLKEATLKQIREFKIPCDLIVFRGNRNFSKAHVFKEDVVTDLNIDNIVEIHEDSPTVCEAFLKYCKRGIYYWYDVGKYLFIPSAIVYVDKKPIYLPDLYHDKILNYPRKQYLVEWLSYKYVVRDELELLSLLHYIRSILGKLNGTYFKGTIFEEKPSSIYRSVSTGYSAKGYIIFEGKTYRGVEKGIWNLDELFSPKMIKENIYDYGLEAIRIAIDSTFRFSSPATADLSHYFEDMYVTALKRRANWKEEKNPPTIDLKRLGELKEKWNSILKLAVYTAYNLDKSYLFLLEEPPSYFVEIKYGGVYVGKPVGLEETISETCEETSNGTLQSALKEMFRAHKEIMDIRRVEDKLKSEVKEVLRKYGIPMKNIYGLIAEDTVVGLALIDF